MKPSGNPLVDPCEGCFCEPTLSAELDDLEFDGVEKINFGEIFERPQFTGERHVPQLNRFGKQVFDRQ